MFFYPSQSCERLPKNRRTINGTPLPCSQSLSAHSVVSLHRVCLPRSVNEALKQAVQAMKTLSLPMPRSCMLAPWFLFTLIRAVNEALKRSALAPVVAAAALPLALLEAASGLVSCHFPVSIVMVIPLYPIVPACASRKIMPALCRQPTLVSTLPGLVVPTSASSDFTGSVAGNRHYPTCTIERQLLLVSMNVFSP